MQTTVTLATLAAAAFAKEAAYILPAVEIEDEDEDGWTYTIMDSSVSGRWDLLENGSKHDMLLTFTHRVNWYEDADVAGMWTCFKFDAD